MRTASARALWPFFVRFSAPSPAWIARAVRAPPATLQQINFPHAELLMFIFSTIGRRG
jgi:hypothetical protein